MRVSIPTFLVIGALAATLTVCVANTASRPTTTDAGSLATGALAAGAAWLAVKEEDCDAGDRWEGDWDCERQYGRAWVVARRAEVAALKKSDPALYKAQKAAAKKGRPIPSSAAAPKKAWFKRDSGGSNTTKPAVAVKSTPTSVPKATITVKSPPPAPAKTGK